MMKEKRIYKRPKIEMIPIKVESLMLTPSTYRSTRYDGSSLKPGHELDGKVEEVSGGTFTGFAKWQVWGNYDD